MGILGNNWTGNLLRSLFLGAVLATPSYAQEVNPVQTDVDPDPVTQGEQIETDGEQSTFDRYRNLINLETHEPTYDGEADADRIAPVETMPHEIDIRQIYNRYQNHVFLPNATNTLNIPDYRSHPLAGMVVDMQLEVIDGMGQTALQTVSVQIPVPYLKNEISRQFMELRRELALDANNAPEVTAAIGAIIEEYTQTQEFPNNTLPTEELRDALIELHTTLSNTAVDDIEGLDRIVGEMWQFMMELEAETLTLAEKRLLEAEQALMEAFENEASMEEIQELMEEYRDALEEVTEERIEAAREQGLEREEELLEQMQEALERMEQLMEQMQNADPELQEMLQQQMTQQMQQMQQMQQEMQQGQNSQGEQQQREQQMQQMQQQQEMQENMMEAMEAIDELIEDQEEIRDETLTAQEETEQDLEQLNALLGEYAQEVLDAAEAQRTRELERQTELQAQVTTPEITEELERIEENLERLDEIEEDVEELQDDLENDPPENMLQYRVKRNLLNTMHEDIQEMEDHEEIQQQLEDLQTMLEEYAAELNEQGEPLLADQDQVVSDIRQRHEQELEDFEADLRSQGRTEQDIQDALRTRRMIQTQVLNPHDMRQRALITANSDLQRIINQLEALRNRDATISESAAATTKETLDRVRDVFNESDDPAQTNTQTQNGQQPPQQGGGQPDPSELDQAAEELQQGQQERTEEREESRSELDQLLEELDQRGEDLEERQRELREQLNEVRDEMREQGMETAENGGALNTAGNEMNQSAADLNNGDPETSLEDQQEALDALDQAKEEIMQQMQEMMQQQPGQGQPGEGEPGQGQPGEGQPAEEADGSQGSPPPGEDGGEQDGDMDPLGRINTSGDVDITPEDQRNSVRDIRDEIIRQLEDETISAEKRRYLESLLEQQEGAGSTQFTQPFNSGISILRP